MPFCIDVPKVSLTCMNTTDFGAEPAGLEDLLLIGEGIAQDHRRGGEVAEHELVALLGDRRGGRDVDDERDALLLGHLGNRRALAGVEGADEQLRALADQPLGARAGDLDVGSRCPPFMMARSGRPRSLRMPAVISTPRWQSWPMPACTPERGSSTPTFRGAPCARPIWKGAGGGKQARGAGSGGKAAPRHGGPRPVGRAARSILHCSPPLIGPDGPRSIAHARRSVERPL